MKKNTIKKPLYSQTDSERIVKTKKDPHFRTAFRRDNGRLIHSAVFRRLQGKTQLFPNDESDFFRNRLTHSIEVAQIAKGIAEKINNTVEYFKKYPIDTDLVETAALAHDLGHPPFGHNGEKALDDMMKLYGGFEGNAQTLRILSRLEKKTTINEDCTPIKNGKDCRCGLNLSYRTLASILKYDNEIPMCRKEGGVPEKGYYHTEKEIVQEIRKHVLGSTCDKKLKTIECQIMDVADDIAYSTYDLEDTFKAGFLSPLSILSSDRNFINRIAEKAGRSIYNRPMEAREVTNILTGVYETVFREAENFRTGSSVSELAQHAFHVSREICTDGYLRTRHTSSLVNEFMSGVQVNGIDKDNPPLSIVCLKPETRKKVEVLKRYTYYAVIESSRLKMAEFRGYDIVKEIFETLANDSRRGFTLLPEDFRQLYSDFDDNVALKRRVLCDFIAGMTDRYAVEFYARLKSENPQTIFKPF